MTKSSRARGSRTGIGPLGCALALAGMALLRADAAIALPPPGNGGSGGGPRTCTASVTFDQPAVTIDLGTNWPGTTYPFTGGARRIRAIDGDCQTTYYPVSRAFRQTQRPPQSAAQLVVTGATAKLTTDKLGAYSVAVDLCPGGCTVLGTTLPMRTVTYTMMAVSTKNLPPQTAPLVAKLGQTMATDFCHSLTSCSASPFVGEQDVDVKCDFGNVASPQWVTVEPFVGAQSLRLVEGWAEASGIAGNDLWLNHSSKDMNVEVYPDPQLAFLASKSGDGSAATLEIEWERSSVPERFRPSPGDRVSAFGYHIHDCGHAPYKTEIHPPVGTAVHRARPVRIPSNVTFDLPGGRATVGTNVWVPGIVTDIFFDRNAGGILGDSFAALHQPGSRTGVPLPNQPGIVQVATGAAIRGPASLDRTFTFHVYLPPSPAKVYGDKGPVPLFTQVVPFAGTPASHPVPTIVESTDADGTRYLTVTVDLRGFRDDTYASRIVAAWVYPSAKNWGLRAYSVRAKGINVYDTGDVTDGDWRLWLNVPNASNVTDGNEWLKIFDCNDCMGEGPHTPASWSRSLTDLGGTIREPVRMFPGETMRVRTIGYDSDTIWDDDIGGIDEEYSYDALGTGTVTGSYQSSTGYYRFDYEIAPAPAVGAAVLSAGATALFDAYAMKGMPIAPGALLGGHRAALDGATAPAPGGPPLKASTLGDLRFKGTKERNIFTLTDAERVHALATAPARQAFERDLQKLRQRVCGRLGTPRMRQKTMGELSKIKGGIPADLWQRVFGDLERGGTCASSSVPVVRDHRIIPTP